MVVMGAAGVEVVVPEVAVLAVGALAGPAGVVVVVVGALPRWGSGARWRS